ncbi:hypothetical protein NSTC731_03607 [Nostoc sp. DSM 114167]|jgi:hypothetical protein
MNRVSTNGVFVAFFFAIGITCFLYFQAGKEKMPTIQDSSLNSAVPEITTMISMQ